MTDPVETEIKLAASPAMLGMLRTHPKLAGADQTGTLVTTYFDTTSGRLRSAGATLRIRVSGKSSEQTLKLTSSGGLYVRRKEWNVAAEGDLPEPSGFPVRARSALARLLDGDSLEPVATTRIERMTRRLHFGGSAINIAFDLGTIEVGGHVEAIYELEMELVKGRLTDIMALVLHLPLGPELRWSVSSKAERCHALAFNLQPAAVLAQPANLFPRMDVAKGFQAIAWNCLGQLLANYPLVIASGDPEAVHQSRVAIRRLRAACSLFGNVADDEEAPVLRAELKAVAMGLGPARDLHILIGQVEAAAKGSDLDVAELLSHLGARRDSSTRSAQTMLGTESFQRLLFQFAIWIEAGQWLARKQETGGDQPLSPFAAHILTRRRRKVRKAGKGVAHMSDAVRHRLRIDVKKLRYAFDFFVPLFRGKSALKPRREFAKALGRLQDSLGELNDMAVAAAGRNSLFTDLEPITAARLVTLLAGLLDSREESRRRLLKAAERSLPQAIDTPAWWKAG